MCQQFEDRSNPQVPKPAPTVSFDLGEPAVSDIGGIAPMPDMRAIERQRKHTMDVMKALPKGLIFDGKSNWFAFKHNFSLQIVISIFHINIFLICCYASLYRLVLSSDNHTTPLKTITFVD